jgi:hypothetical protein
MSLPEVLLWQQLRTRPGGFKFRYQHPFGPYTLDFYCRQAALAVEGRRRLARDGRQSGARRAAGPMGGRPRRDDVQGDCDGCAGGDGSRSAHGGASMPGADALNPPRHLPGSGAAEGWWRGLLTSKNPSTMLRIVPLPRKSGGGIRRERPSAHCRYAWRRTPIDSIIAVRDEALGRFGAFKARATLLFQCLLRGV